MNRAVLTIILACLSLYSFAQWSADANNPTLISGIAGEQVIPKVAVTNSGYTYICRFDNSSGGYYVYLNLLSPDGSQVWAMPNGLLVSDNPSMSWLTDYDMTVDNDGNAVIVFQDIRNAGANNVYAYKISPEGTFLWGEDGIALSADTNPDISNMSPTVFNASDNSTYVAWQKMSTATEVMVQRLSADGTLTWGPTGLTIGVTGASCTWPQVIQGEGGNVLIKYYQDSGPFWAPNRHIYVSRYTPIMAHVWTALITNAGGITAWQQIIPFEPDGTGGAVLAWYEDREVDMDNDIYCQRVNTSGSVTMPQNGALVSSDPVNQQYYPYLAIDPANEQVFVFFRCTDANQNLSGLGRQMLDYSGNRLWGETAPMEIPITSIYVNTVGAYYTPNGAVCLYEYDSDNLYAGCWRASGVSGWPAGPTLVAATDDTKYHFDLDTHPDNWAVLAWEQGMSAMDIYAMRINSTGSIGPEYLPPRELGGYLLPPDTAVLYWEHPSLYVLPENYRVFMDGELAQTVPGNQAGHQIPNLSPGEHQFYVIAAYPGEHYSPPSQTITISVVSADDPVQVPVLSALRISPNPCYANLNLSFSAGKAGTPYRISVYNLRGQVLWTGEGITQSGINGLDLRDALPAMGESGVYLLRVETPEAKLATRFLRLK